MVHISDIMRPTFKAFRLLDILLGKFLLSYRQVSLGPVEVDLLASYSDYIKLPTLGILRA